MKKTFTFFLTAIMLLMSLMVSPISAADEDPVLNCNEWMLTSNETIFCAHEDCGVLLWAKDGTSYQMHMYVRYCSWTDEPNEEPFTQVKRDDVYVGCCDYPYA